MNKLTYQEAYNKIIDAYFKDEIKPFNAEFCFCGTLSPDCNWGRSVYTRAYPYSVLEYTSMEKGLFSEFDGIVYLDTQLVSFYDTNGSLALFSDWLEENQSKYEDMLFNGMCAALDVLKEIHRSRGEDVDSIQSPFTKRILKEKV